MHPLPKRLFLFLCAIILVQAACAFPRRSAPPATAEITETPAIALATPAADMPAAGICGVFEGDRVTIRVEPGIPDPRCVQVRTDQMLTVVNVTEGTLDVSFGSFQASLAPGESFDIDLPFGSYLAPGVHVIGVRPCCGAELVFGVDLNP